MPLGITISVQRDYILYSPLFAAKFATANVKILFIVLRGGVFNNSLETKKIFSQLGTRVPLNIFELISTNGNWVAVWASEFLHLLAIPGRRGVRNVFLFGRSPLQYDSCWRVDNDAPSFFRFAHSFRTYIICLHLHGARAKWNLFKDEKYFGITFLFHFRLAPITMTHVERENGHFLRRRGNCRRGAYLFSSFRSMDGARIGIRNFFFIDGFSRMLDLGCEVNFFFYIVFLIHRVDKKKA